MQDGAPPHIALPVQLLLRSTFGRIALSIVFQSRLTVRECIVQITNSHYRYFTYNYRQTRALAFSMQYKFKMHNKTTLIQSTQHETYLQEK